MNRRELLSLPLLALTPPQNPLQVQMINYQGPGRPNDVDPKWAERLLEGSTIDLPNTQTRYLHQRKQNVSIQATNFLHANVFNHVDEVKKKAAKAFPHSYKGFWQDHTHIHLQLDQIVHSIPQPAPTPWNDEQSVHRGNDGQGY